MGNTCRSSAKQTISGLEIVFMIFSAGLGPLIYMLTSVCRAADRASWVACLVGGAILFPIIIWIINLSRWSTQDTILQILEKATSKILGKLFCIVYIGICLSMGFTLLKLYIGSINTFLLRNTPIWMIGIFVLLISAFIAGSGIEIIGRMQLILSPILFLIYFGSFIIGIFNKFSIENITPVFTVSLAQFADGAYLSACLMSTAVLFLFIMVYAFPKSAQNIKYVKFVAVIMPVNLSLAILLLIGVLGVPIVNRVSFGGINAVNILKLGRYIQGVDVFILIAFTLQTTLFLSQQIFAVCMASKQIFSRVNRFIFLSLAAVIIFLFTVISDSYSQIYIFVLFLYRYVTIPFIIATLIIATAGIILKKRYGLKNEV